MTPPGQIETCRRCGVSFAMRPGESDSSFVFRYTAWRESHQGCVLDEAEAARPEPEGECSLPKLSQVEAETQAAEHAPCTACASGYTFSAYVCPDWGDHWHVIHGIRAPAQAEPVTVRVKRRRPATVAEGRS